MRTHRNLWASKPGVCVALKRRLYLQQGRRQHLRFSFTFFLTACCATETSAITLMYMCTHACMLTQTQECTNTYTGTHEWTYTHTSSQTHRHVHAHTHYIHTNNSKI